MKNEILRDLHVSHNEFHPVFVIGAPRSGTSMLIKLIRKYLKINFGTESQFIIRYYNKLQTYGNLKQKNNLRMLVNDISGERCFRRWESRFGFKLDIEKVLENITEPNYPNILKSIFGQFADYHGMARWGDKTPEYVYDLPVLLELFPTARFLHIIRDGRDVALSEFKLGFGAKNVYKSATSWREKITLINMFAKQLPPEQYLEIRYEDLLSDPVTVMSRMIGFFKINDPGLDLLKFIESHIFEDIISNNFFKWKDQLTDRERNLFEKLSGDVLRAYHYETRILSSKSLNLLEKAKYEADHYAKKYLKYKSWQDNFYKMSVNFKNVRRHKVLTSFGIY